MMSGLWTQLGAATSPANACGVKLGVAGGQPTFYLQAGVCDGRARMGPFAADQLWKFVGTTRRERGFASIAICRAVVLESLQSIPAIRTGFTSQT
jgi:hypothetical protein